MRFSMLNPQYSSAVVGGLIQQTMLCELKQAARPGEESMGFRLRCIAWRVE